MNIVKILKNLFNGHKHNHAANNEFPVFQYFPNPVEAESVVKSTLRCVCCGRRRGYIYVGPAYCYEEIEGKICPWCIKDNSAHEKFNAQFNPSENVGHLATFYNWDVVNEKVIEEIAYRTPGFDGWQEPVWWSHCGDAGEFLEVGGYSEIVRYGDECVNYFKDLFEELGYYDKGLDACMKRLAKDGHHTAYLFRCRHCGKIGGYHDSD